MGLLLFVQFVVPDGAREKWVAIFEAAVVVIRSNARARKVDGRNRFGSKMLLQIT